MEAFNRDDGEYMHYLLNNDAFIAEMNKRFDEYEKSKTKLIPLGEVERKALAMIAKMKKAS